MIRVAQKEKNTMQVTPELIKRSEELGLQLSQICDAIEDRFEAVLNSIAKCFDVKIDDWYFCEEVEILDVVNSTYLESGFIEVEGCCIIRTSNDRKFDYTYILYGGKPLNLSYEIPINFLFMSSDEVESIILEGIAAYQKYREIKKAKSNKAKQTKKEKEAEKLCAIMSKLTDDEKVFLNGKIK